MIPAIVSNISEYLVEAYSAEKTKRSLPAPQVIKGESGTGKSWILNRVYQALDEDPNRTILPVSIPLHLNGEGLVEDIWREIEFAKFRYLKAPLPNDFNVRPRVLVFIENIDRIFNLATREKLTALPTRARGYGAAHIAQIQHASELRSFIIENSSFMSVIASAEDTSFLEDADLPFFQFFNVISVKTLGIEDCREYLHSEKHYPTLARYVMSAFESINPNWIHVLTDGRIAYLNLLKSLLVELDAQSVKENNLEALLHGVLNLYFHRIVPYMDLILERLSYQERSVVDRIVLLSDGYYARDITGFDSNISYVLSNLRTKGIVLSQGEGHAAKYMFKSLTLKAFLRFYKKGNAFYVLRTNEPMGSAMKIDRGRLRPKT